MPMKTKKTPEDDIITAAVQAALNKGPKSNKALRASLGTDGKTSDPRLDRTLQNLRKQGKIKVVEGKWHLAAFQTCPTCKGKGWLEE